MTHDGPAHRRVMNPQEIGYLLLIIAMSNIAGIDGFVPLMFVPPGFPAPGANCSSGYGGSNCSIRRERVGKTKNLPQRRPPGKALGLGDFPDVLLGGNRRLEIFHELVVTEKELGFQFPPRRFPANAGHDEFTIALAGGGEIRPKLP